MLGSSGEAMSCSDPDGEDMEVTSHRALRRSLSSFGKTDGQSGSNEERACRDGASGPRMAGDGQNGVYDAPRDGSVDGVKGMTHAAATTGDGCAASNGSHAAGKAGSDDDEACTKPSGRVRKPWEGLLGQPSSPARDVVGDGTDCLMHVDQMMACLSTCRVMLDGSMKQCVPEES